METFTQILPVESVNALLNSDDSGLSDFEIVELGEYTLGLKDLGYYAIPFMPKKVCEFYTSNDLNNVGGDCFEVEFQKL